MTSQITNLLRKAYELHASDLHILVNSPPKYRIDGVLQSYGNMIMTKEQTSEMAQELLGNNWDKFQSEDEFDFSYKLDETSRFRVNIFKQKQAISIAARLIPVDIPTIKQLKLPEVLTDLMHEPYGLILVTGPTGSGKTTTLASMIDYANEMMNKHIITFEDPIEYIHEQKQSIIQQREVGLDTKKFSTGLRAALRQDPDILLVGEMRDLETISTAITAAETGHLVLATLHTNSAVQTINRIIDVFPPHQQGQIRIQLASVIKAVISQRLFRRADGPGRVPATEIMIGVPAVASLIRQEKVEQIQNVLQTGKEHQMHTLEHSIYQLIRSGKVDEQEAKRYLPNVGDK